MLWLPEPGLTPHATAARRRREAEREEMTCNDPMSRRSPSTPRQTPKRLPSSAFQIYLESQEVTHFEFSDVDDLVLGEVEAPPPPSPELPIHVTGEVVKPERLVFVPPVYTEMARRARVQGIVVLQAIIDTDGSVTDVTVLKPLPLGLGESAVDAASQWKYRPATLNGRPVAVYFSLTVRFELQ